MNMMMMMMMLYKAAHTALWFLHMKGIWYYNWIFICIIEQHSFQNQPREINKSGPIVSFVLLAKGVHEIPNYYIKLKLPSCKKTIHNILIAGVKKWQFRISFSSSSSICHGVGPLVDPFRSHVSRSFFKGLPW